MRKIFALLVSTSVLTGCATYKPTIPDGYTGPRASIKDTVKVYSVSKADFFYVSHVNSNEIENSRIKTRIENYGRGMYMNPVVLQHKIPAQSATLSIVGRTEYAAPILALTNPVYEVKGVVDFTPENNKTYAVRGELGRDYSVIWVEEEGSNIVVGKKIEVKGSAELGIFEK